MKAMFLFLLVVVAVVLISLPGLSIAIASVAKVLSSLAAL